MSWAGAMKLGWADWATDGKNQDGSRVGVATVAAMVWPFPVWVCNGNRWQSEAWWQREAWAAARVFFFIVFVSPLFSFHFFPSFLVFLHFRFSLVPFVPFARFSFFILKGGHILKNREKSCRAKRKCEGSNTWRRKSKKQSLAT